MNVRLQLDKALEENYVEPIAERALMDGVAQIADTWNRFTDRIQRFEVSESGLAPTMRRIAVTALVCAAKLEEDV